MFDFTAQALDDVPIGDCMRHGLVTCDAAAALPEVAAIMTAHRVHAVVVLDDSGRPCGIVSDLDVIGGAARGEQRHAGEVARTGALAASSEHSLRDAARLMAEHGASHVIVSDHRTGLPVGVLSSSDVLSAYALTAGHLT